MEKTNVNNAESNALVAVLHTEKLAIAADIKALGVRMEADGVLLKRLMVREDMVDDMLDEYAVDIEHPAGFSKIFLNALDPEVAVALMKTESALPRAAKLSPQETINREAVKRAGPPTPRVLPEKKVTAPMPPVEPTLGQRPPAAPAAVPAAAVSVTAAIVTTDDGMREFAHGSRKTKFDIKEWRFVSQLYMVMTRGGGMLPSKIILDHVFKGERSPPDARLWCEDMALTVKKRLADVGLETRPYEKMSFSMREIES
jgi:hypothetical protein